MLNKIVNCIEVQCTPEEEAEIRAEWARNDALSLQAQSALQAQATAKASATAKLTALGLTADEITALIG